MSRAEVRARRAAESARQGRDRSHASARLGLTLRSVLIAPHDGFRAALSAAERRERVAAQPEVLSVAPPQFSRAGDAAVLLAIPRTSVQDEATQRLVDRLRDDVAPALQRSSGMTVHVGGMTAAFTDQSAYTLARLPLFIGAVVSLSFLLLLAAFRSLPVALKAGVLNLLSIGAAYGVVALVASGGWAGQLVGIDTPTPVPPFIPVFMFAILFGLSMDYEVFLLSRIREEYLRHGDNARAVSDGLATTARVITAAAAIMIAVFSSFALADDVILKLMGIGLSTAILVDATIVRMVLVPSIMQLLGRVNWWLPGWIERLLPGAPPVASGAERDPATASGRA
ncbi:MAG: MMPL family transporter [Actinobacteria bacterium]|nr:MMPL family transporter [Actinomycetota bacterium]